MVLKIVIYLLLSKYISLKLEFNLKKNVIYLLKYFYLL